MKKKGFTLMELLIVVAVISIMVAIAIPTFSIQKRRAAENTDIGNVSALWTQLGSEYAIYGKFKSNNTLTNMICEYNPNNENAKDLTGLIISPASGWTPKGTVTIRYEREGENVVWYADCT